MRSGKHAKAKAADAAARRLRGQSKSAPELIRGSPQGVRWSGCARPAIEGPKKERFALGSPHLPNPSSPPGKKYLSRAAQHLNVEVELFAQPERMILMVGHVLTCVGMHQNC